ncbi:hypothetical protein TRM7557_01258 [Tritonibacter multivorans]|uniref:Phospholipase D-like domain-containing protein n=2 Tax=Tritonibacter multivorans TaxID=928856 RepID=A0A0P1G666_9RHOB|nr:hypothetical protein TRM7557_01258 [Tritonibacter multivorans]SFD52282.1 hypothetical protein SAMN04488049_11552 [Tritonibacter multivorans]
MKILPGRVRVHPTLHSKIYASEKRAVLGSANASAPGLCWNETGHDEAAAMMKGDDASSAFELAKKFYRKGKSASEEHLQMCRERFGRRTLASTVTCTYNADGDAGRENPIDTFLRRADVFGALPVIISEGNADPKVLEKDWQEQRAESEELPENATFNGLEWSYFQWPLDKRYRGKACLEIHKESNGHLSLHVVQPIFHEGSVGTFARRLSWPDVGDLGQHWRAKVRNIGSDGTLNRVHRALRKKAYLTGWDVYAKYRAKSTS